MRGWPGEWWLDIAGFRHYVPGRHSTLHGAAVDIASALAKRIHWYLRAGEPVLDAEYVQDGESRSRFCAADIRAGITGALFGVALRGGVYEPCAPARPSTTRAFGRRTMRDVTDPSDIGAPRHGKGSRIFAPGLLDGQVAIVSGGGSGLGRAIALELAALGARVVVCGRRAEPLAETVALGPEGLLEPAVCDIREEDQVAALVDGVLARSGTIDLLVNNAGGQFLSPAEDITPKGFRTVIRLNVEGTWLMTHAVATRAMIPARAGKVVSITISPHHGLPGMAHSSAARAAVENLTRVLSIEWSRFEIRLNAIAAGQFATDTLTTKYPKPIVRSLADTIPLGRLGEPDEIAWLVAYLASPAGDFISGAVLTVDGARDDWFGGWPPAAAADAGGRLLAEQRRRDPQPPGDRPPAR